MLVQYTDRLVAFKRDEEIKPVTYSDYFKTEWIAACKRLTESGVDLSKILITKRG